MSLTSRSDALNLGICNISRQGAGEFSNVRSRQWTDAAAFSRHWARLAMKSPVAVERVFVTWGGELSGRASSNACRSKWPLSIGQLCLFEQKAQVSTC